jgi:thermitase
MGSLMNIPNLRSRFSAVVTALFCVVALNSPAWSIRPDARDSLSQRFPRVAAGKDPFRQGFQNHQPAEKALQRAGAKWKGRLGPKSALVDWMGARFQEDLSASGVRLVLVSNQKDEQGWRHLGFDQTWKGIPILGARLLVHVDPDRKVQAVTGRVASKPAPTNQQTLTSAKAVELSLALFADGNRRQTMKAPRLVLLNDLLAWEVRLSDADGHPGELLYLDAQTGAVVHHRGLKLHAAPDPLGTPTTVSGNLLVGEGGQMVSFPGWQNPNGPHFLHSQTNGWGVYDQQVRDWEQGSSADWGTTDRAAVSLGHNMQLVQEYTRDVLQRNSWDNLGRFVPSYVHEGTNYVNAYWDGSSMHIGDGDGVSASPLATLDIVAHEFGHAITQATSDLVYVNESGALNESYSDIFGALVEFHVQQDGRTSYPSGPEGRADWLMGEDAWLSSEALRDLRDPRRFGQPSYYRGTNWYTGTGDNGGVHTNSGVMNHLFYLLAEGGTGSNDGHPYSITGLGIVAAGRIAMYANTYLQAPNDGYPEARQAWVLAAQILGLDTATVSRAWSAVGVREAIALAVFRPSTLDAGTVTLGRSRRVLVTLANEGDAVLFLSSIRHSDPGATILGGVSSLAAGASATLSVDWIPSTLGSFTHTIEAFSPGQTDPVATATITGTVSTGPMVDVLPASLTETLGYGTTSQKMLRFVNRGIADATWTLREERSTQSLAARSYSLEHFLPVAKGDLGLQGEPTTSLSGGPDAFGYRWIDSNDPNGPAYVWNSIAVPANLLSTVSSCDDCTQPVSFLFGLYGTNATTVQVSSNGIITLSGANTSYSNVPLPSTSAPLSMVAAFWDDLNPGTAGDVYAKVLDDRLVVEWNQVALFANSASLNTFQIHLHRDGLIRFYYQDVTGATSSTVGIQNGAGTTGLQVAYNSAYLQDRMAVEIFTRSPWMSVPVASGVVPAGGETEVAVAFDARSTLPGNYSSQLRAEFDGETGSSILVPVQLAVTGCKSLTVQPGVLVFPQTFVGGRSTATLELVNGCTETTTLTSFEIGVPDFQLLETLPVSVAAGARRSLRVQFLPSSADSLFTIAVLTSDADPDRTGSRIQVGLSGVGLLAPSAAIAPDSLVFRVSPQGAPVDAVAVLRNNGGSDLVWSLRAVRSISSPAFQPLAGAAVVDHSRILAPSNLAQPAVPGRLIVGLKAGINSLSESALSSVPMLKVVALATARKPGAFQAAFATRRLVLVHFDETRMSRDEAMQVLGKDPSVEYAEPDFVVNSIRIPNDPSYSLLYGMDKIQAPLAWDSYTGDQNVKVGIIDTGLDYLHPDLIDNVWTNPGEIPGNSLDDDGNGFVDDIHGWDFANDDANPMDDNGHGTHCAGTIAGRGDNGVGVAGVTWKARLAGLKFLGSGGSGSISDAVDALAYANAMGFPITSNSWGGGGYSQALNDLLASAGLFVAAAGNSSSNNDASPHYPSSYTADNVLAVASTTNTDGLSSFSSYGLTSVDLGAPGSSIYSTYPGNSYATLSGTSMATPHVSGAAAYLLGADPSLSAVEIKQVLMASVDPIPALTNLTVTGGRLNLAKAREALRPPYLTVTPSAGGTVVAGGTTNLQVRVDPTNLVEGVYLSHVVVQTNDPVRDSLILPVRIEVGTIPVVTHTINAGSLGGGTITPSGSVSVIEGGSARFTFAALPDNRLFSVLVDGVVVDSTEGYTFRDVTADHMITAYFEPLPVHTINAGSLGGGTITPSGSVSVIEGGSTRFTFAALPDNRLFSVLVDGVVVDSTEGYTFRDVTADHMITAYFEPLPALTINSEALGGGTITPSGSVPVAYGGSTRFTFAPTYGNRLQRLLVDGIAVDSTEGYTFRDVTANHQISALFEPIPAHTITASEVGSGSINPWGQVSVAHGGNVRFTFAAMPGYRVDRVLVDDVDVDSTEGYTFRNVVADHRIVAHFALLPTYIVSAEIVGEGTITPAGDVVLMPGETRRFVFTASAGNRLRSVLVDGIAVDSTEGYTFRDVTANHRIVANFEPVPTQLCDERPLPRAASWVVRNAWADQSNGSSTRNTVDAMEVVHRQWGKTDLWLIGDGERFDFVSGVQKEISFEFRNSSAAPVQGIALALTNGINWDSPMMVGTSVAVTGPFVSGAYQRYTVRVTPAATGRFGIGLRLTWTNQPSSQFVAGLRSVKVCDGTPVVTRTIQASAGVGGTITPTGAVSVADGGSQTFAIAPSAGYRTRQILVDGVAVPVAATYSFTNVRANRTIAVSFEAIPSYTITASAGLGGTITPAGAVSVTEGGSQTFAIAPSAGYRIGQILVNGVAVPVAATFSFTNVRANQTIAVSFEAIPSYTITASAGVGGSITPSGAVNVVEGGSQAFTITASAGYRIGQILVNGVAVPVAATVSFTNVRANQTIAVSFEAVPTYTITASAGVGGSITPAGATTVTEGGSQAYTIAASAGYRIGQILVNGVAVPVAATYSFTNVRANQTIAVSFEAIPSYTITASAGVGGSITPSGAVSVVEGGNQVFAITASAGYRVRQILVNGVAVPVAATYSFTNVRANQTIAVSFEVVTSTCTIANAVDLGGFGSETRNLPGNACVKITQYPAWWNNTRLQFGTITGGTYPANFSWSTTCAGSGTGTFTAEWQSVYLEGVSRTCPTLIEFRGQANQTIGLRWY